MRCTVQMTVQGILLKVFAPFQDLRPSLTSVCASLAEHPILFFVIIHQPAHKIKVIFPIAVVSFYSLLLVLLIWQVLSCLVLSFNVDASSLCNAVLSSAHKEPADNGLRCAGSLIFGVGGLDHQDQDQR